MPVERFTNNLSAGGPNYVIGVCGSGKGEIPVAQSIGWNGGFIRRGDTNVAYPDPIMITITT